MVDSLLVLHSDVAIQLEAIMDSVDLKIEANKEKACALAKELKILNQRTHEQQMM